MHRDQTLTDRRILVVEDDPLIALDLQDILLKAGAVVIGPASQLSTADSLIQQYRLDAAVLDVRLEIGTTLPLADRLAAAGIPFLFQTSDPGAIGDAHPTAPVLRKPFRSEQLIEALQALLANR